MGVAAYHVLVCAVYSVRVSMCREGINCATKQDKYQPYNVKRRAYFITNSRFYEQFGMLWPLPKKCRSKKPKIRVFIVSEAI